MSYKFNIFTRQLDYYEKNTGNSGSGQITNLSIVFCEEFVGDGGTTSFTLTGSLLNAVFQTGSWSISRVENTLPSHITNSSNKALYDSSNIFTKNRISINSINGSTGEVILNEPPVLLQSFKIWYWYTLKETDVLSSYYREEFVASMEGNISIGDNLPAQNILLNTTNFNKILSSLDDSVQKAMNTIDDHTHTDIPIDLETHRTIDQLVHDLDENHYQEYNYSGWQINSIVIWDSPSKNVKIREFFYTYSDIRVVTEVINQYDNTGSLIETLTYSFDYSDNRIVNVYCVRS